jgi:hypothetical protein
LRAFGEFIVQQKYSAITTIAQLLRAPIAILFIIDICVKSKKSHILLGDKLNT